MRLKRIIPIIGIFLCVVTISVPALADSVTFNSFTIEYDSDVSTYNGVYVTDLYSTGAIADVESGVELNGWSAVAHWDFKPKFYYNPSDTSSRTRYLNGLVTFEYSTELIPFTFEYFKIRTAYYEPQFLISSESSEYMQIASYIKPNGESVVFNIYFYNYPIANLPGPTYIECPSVSVSQGFEILSEPSTYFGLDTLLISVTQGIANYSANAISLSNFPDTSKGLADIITQSIIVGILQAQQSGDLSQIVSLLNSMLAIDDYSFNAIIQYLSSISVNNTELVEILRTILSGDRALYLEFTRRMTIMQSSLGDIVTLLDELVHGSAPFEFQTAVSSVVGGFQGGISAMEGLSKPDIQGVLSSISADQLSLNGVDSDIFYYLYSSRILHFLVVAFSLAIVGYLLYGRGQ